MQVDKIRMRDFLSYKDATLALSDLGLVLLEGENRDRGGTNGSGKTALLDAIYWSLYGETIRPIAVSQIARRGQLVATVELWLTVGDIKVYVLRQSSPEKSSKKPQLRLELDGKDVSLGTIAQTQKKIDQLLKMDAFTFRTVVLFPSNAVGFASLTDKGQKEILTGLLKCSRFEAAYTKCYNKHSEVQASVNAAQGFIEYVDKQLAQRQANLSHLQQAQGGHAAKRAADISNAEKVLKALEAQEPKPDVALVKRAGVLKTQVEERRAGTGSAKDELKLVLSKLATAEGQLVRAAAGLQNAANACQHLEVPDLEDLLKGKTKCPSCEQDLPPKAMKALRTSLEAQVKASELDVKKAEEKFALLTGQESRIRKDIEAIKVERDKLQEKIAGLPELELELARAQIALDNQKHAHRQWSQLVKAGKDALAQAQKQECPYGPLIKAEEEAIAKLEGEKAEQIATRKAYGELLRYLRFWKDGFGRAGIISYLLDTVTPYLDERANFYLKILTGGEAQVNFSAQQPDGLTFRDKFSVSAGYTKGAETYRGTSDGERRRVDIACLFALGDLAASRSLATCRLRMLDEPFAPLDDVGHEQVVRLLKDHIAPGVGTILVTSHESTLKALIDRRIVVTKSNGISSVEE